MTSDTRPRPDPESVRVPDGGALLVVDKPVGPTSHDVVSHARRVFRTRRIGHTGTLDPLASGVLLLCLGPATRLSQFLVGADKRYRTTIRFGVETDSLDADGAVVAEDDAWTGLSESRIRDAVADLVGSHDQVPPAFSAKKVGGERAHRRARRGESVELEPVPVTVHAASLVSTDLPDVELDLHVSSGTFVRSVARDLARELGTRGHVRVLRRTAVGPFGVADAVDLSAVESGERAPVWVAPVDAVGHLPLYRADRDEARRIGFGQTIDVGPDVVDAAAATDGLVRIEHGGRLAAIGGIVDGKLRPRKVFVTSEVGSG